MSARLVPAAVVSLALAMTLSGCGSASSAIVVSGTVDATLATVTAPTFRAPAVNLDAGFATTTGLRDPVTGRVANKSSNAAAMLSLGTTVRIAQVLVAEGDTVTAGQQLVVLDTGLQKAQLAAATADQQAVTAGIGALADAIDTTYDKQSDIEDAKSKATDGLHTLLTAKAKLLKARAQLLKALPTLTKTLKSLTATHSQLLAKLAQLEAQLAQLEQLPSDPGTDAAIAQVKAAIAGVNAAIAKVEAGIAKVTPALQKVRAGLRTVGAALPKVLAGLTKVRTALRKISDGLGKIADARTSLRGKKGVAAAQAKVLQVPVDLARTQLSLATLTAPVDGVVVSVASVGEQLASNATVVSIRQTQPSKVTAWLSPSQLDQVCGGDSASIAGDWMTGSGVPARLTRITTAADYPPTSVATEEVHLTRAVEVEFTATEQLPAGVPVEISIQGCRPAAGTTTDSNR